MRKTDLSELRRTVEALRSELHPELDSEFLAAVISAEEQNPEADDQQEALRQIQTALSEALSSKENSSRKRAQPGKGRR